MSTDPCVIRNYCSADLEEYVEFHTDAESICRSEDTFLVAALKDESRAPIDFSESDFFLARARGAIVGSCRIVPEVAIDRAVLRLLLRPGPPSREVASELLRSALERAGDLNVNRVHADLREQDSDARDLFAGLGFRPIRRYTDMALDLDPGSIAEPEQKSLSFRSLEPGMEREFTQLQNRVFAGSWGFCPNTTPEIIQQLGVAGHGHEGVILAYHEEKAAGYCWTAHVSRWDRKGETALGRIHMMGVTPELRGRGLSRDILWAGLKHLANKGVQTVELTMDNENEAACSLYKGAGFRPKTALIWYEKRMR